MAQPNEVNNLSGIDLVQLREWQDSGKSIHCQNKQTKNKKQKRTGIASGNDNTY